MTIFCTSTVVKLWKVYLKKYLIIVMYIWKNEVNEQGWTTHTVSPEMIVLSWIYGSESNQWPWHSFPPHAWYIYDKELKLTNDYDTIRMLKLNSFITGTWCHLQFCISVKKKIKQTDKSTQSYISTRKISFFSRSHYVEVLVEWMPKWRSISDQH